MVNRLWIPLLMSVFMHSAWAIDTLSASLDKNPVLAGEYFTLTIEANGKVSGQTPDTSALTADFVVGPMNVGSRTSIINGSVDSKTTWQMQLLARIEGQYTIPAFEVAGVRSQPISLNVLKRQQSDAQNKDIFITTELKPTKLYVQQAGLYVVKLFLGKDLLDGQLSNPEMDDATVTQLGKQAEEYEIVDGRRYMVITREYLVQPQKSGEYEIKAPIFNGQIRENYRRMSVSAMADNTSVEVLPQPNDYQGTWLPSQLVNLGDEYQPNEDTVVVGTPITRTITLTVVGVTKEQLPELTLAQIEGIKSYPDASDRKQMTRDGRVISQLVASFALLPQSPGTYVLPEVSLPWFNTITKRVEYARLPEKTIVVEADPNQPVAALPKVSQQPKINDVIEQDVIQPVKIVQADRNWLDWLLLSSGYFLWILTLLIVFFVKQRAKSHSVKQVASPTVSPDKLSALKTAVKADNQIDFYRALNEHIRYYEKSSIETWLKNIKDNTVKIELNKLQANLYGNKTVQVDLQVIYDLLVRQKKTKENAQGDVLSQLY